MAQFDVYANPSESAAHGIPYVVVVQSDLLDALATRMTIPLATVEFAKKSPDKILPHGHSQRPAPARTGPLHGTLAHAQLAASGG